MIHNVSGLGDLSPPYPNTIVQKKKEKERKGDLSIYINKEKKDK